MLANFACRAWRGDYCDWLNFKYAPELATVSFTEFLSFSIYVYTSVYILSVSPYGFQCECVASYAQLASTYRAVYSK